MALLNLEQDPVEVTVSQLKANLRAAYMTLRTYHENIRQLVWHNHAGLTPQQVLDALGADAAELETALAPIRAAYDTAAPDAKNVLEPLVPADKELQDQDGRIVIADKAVVKP